MQLTELKVKNANPQSKMYRISDGDGLFLQVSPQGGKYWRFRYFYAGKEKMLALRAVKAKTKPEWAEKHAVIDAALAQRDVDFNQKIFYMAKISAVAAITGAILAFVSVILTVIGGLF